MKKFIILLTAFVLSACGSDPSGIGSGTAGSSDYVGTQEITTKLKSTGATVANTNGFSVQATNALQGLYFGEIEIVAYDYRPGEALQTGRYFSNQNTDWSFWVILQSGHQKARNNVLKVGEKLDINALNGAYKYMSLPSAEYINTVGEFDLDIIEVYAYRNGVIYNNVFYGMEAQQSPSALYRYPEFLGITEIGSGTRFPGFPKLAGYDKTFGRQDVNILFIRKDWFPEPVVVGMDVYTRGVIQASSKPLSDFQKSIISSLASQGTQRRFYDNLIIVPQKNEGHTKVKFPTATALKKVESCNRFTKACNKVDVVNPELWADNVKVDINFDLNDSILASPLDWTQNLSQVEFAGDANDVPFGLNIDIGLKVTSGNPNDPVQ